MFSSSSRDIPRRRKVNQKRALKKPNSTLFDTLKGFVAAPFSWLAGTDDFEDSRDPIGKRRRAILPVLPSAEDKEDGPTPSKRIRIHSPDRDVVDSHHGAYLDPPRVAFQNHQQPQDRNLAPSRLAPSISISDIPRNEQRDVLSPLRNRLVRTMSLDPPQSQAFQHKLPREIPSKSFSFSENLDRDVSMEPQSSMSVTGLRDHSMPPSRPAFRMRTSLTPQPTRGVSEQSTVPPSISALGANPTFLHPPPAKEKPSGPTLGMLSEAQRSVRSPSRQHSLLLGSQPIQRNSPLPESFIQKALQELDVYKTPLVPSRLRARGNESSHLGHSYAAGGVDLFRPKRNLVLMPDDRSSGRLGRKTKDVGKKSKEVNRTKPYAGEGGIKKIIARRRKEVEEDGEAERHITAKDWDPSEVTKTQKVKSPSPRAATPLPLSPPPEEVAFNPGGMNVPRGNLPYTSSFRVGRGNRSHLDRPSQSSRPTKNKFSAAFEDDDDVGEQDEAKETETASSEDKIVPIFAAPVDFSFAKEVRATIPQDKEPAPIIVPVALPQPSLSPAPSEPELIKDKRPINAPTNIVPQVSAQAPAPPKMFDWKLPVAAPVKSDLPTPSISNGVPNFFANSKLLEKQSTPVLPSPSIDISSEVKDSEQASNTTSAVPTPSFLSAPAPVPPPAEMDDNPFTVKQPTGTGGLFGGMISKAADDNAPPQDTLPFISSGVSRTTEVLKAKDSANVSITTQPLSFGDSANPSSSFVTSTTKTGGESTRDVFSAVPPASSSAPFGSISTESKASNNLFGGATTAQAGASQFSFTNTSSRSDETAPSKPLFGVLLPQTTSAAESPKSLFGSGGFKFGNQDTSEPAKPTSTLPFGNPPIPETKTSTFSFGNPALTPITSTTPFSFSAGSGSTPSEAHKTFIFGQPPARPVTPPRNDIQDQDRMDESPTRDAPNTATKVVESRPTLGISSSFSFNGSGGFGQVNTPSPVSSPFTFGPVPSSTGFVPAPAKPEEPKSFGGFGQTPSQQGFSFGQPAQESPRPSTTGSFSFVSPTSANTTASPFAFNATNPSSNTFGGSQPSSAPSSPSTFSAAAPTFTFAASSAVTPSNPFSFGSQPASPASVTSMLPQSTAPSFGGFSASAPSPAPAPPSSGGSLFNIGAAPTSTGSRQIKKLPNRRGAKR